jgi:hypothetical protein
VRISWLTIAKKSLFCLFSNSDFFLAWLTRRNTALTTAAITTPMALTTQMNTPPMTPDIKSMFARTGNPNAAHIKAAIIWE